jgi:hypothetical protein
MKLDRITSHPGRMNGQPCVRNMRLTMVMMPFRLMCYLIRVLRAGARSMIYFFQLELALFMFEDVKWHYFPVPI